MGVVALVRRLGIALGSLVAALFADIIGRDERVRAVRADLRWLRDD
jgi:uncharacterized protein YqgC (DUF456 family)